MSAPRVVVVADGSTGPAAQADTREVVTGWRRQAPHTRVEAYLSHDGGAGMAALVAAARGGSVHPVLVPGPTGVAVPAGIALVDTPEGPTAYLDTAEVAGRHLVDPERLRDPAGLDSAGVGVLLQQARALGARRIVVGVGPLACHDAGAGLLRALGAGADLEQLPRVRRHWADVPLVLAGTGTGTLLGFHGASAGLAEHGVTPEVTQRLEGELGDVSDRVNALLPPQRDLITGLPRRPEREPGSGAGGGVGLALQLLGARTGTGGTVLLDELGIRARLPGALLVLVTGTYDWRTVHDGVVADTALAALDSATPTVVLAHRVEVGRREGMALGVSGSYQPRTGESLTDLAARVARTWTPAGGR